MKHLTLFFAFGALLFLSCQTVSARGVKIPFGDREVLNKVADLPDTEEYKTDNGNYIDLGTIHQEFNIAYILPLLYRAGAPPRRILRKRRHLL